MSQFIEDVLIINKKYLLNENIEKHLTNMNREIFNILVTDIKVIQMYFSNCINLDSSSDDLEQQKEEILKLLKNILNKIGINLIELDTELKTYIKSRKNKIEKFIKFWHEKITLENQTLYEKIMLPEITKDIFRLIFKIYETYFVMFMFFDNTITERLKTLKECKLENVLELNLTYFFRSILSKFNKISEELEKTLINIKNKNIINKNIKQLLSLHSNLKKSYLLILIISTYLNPLTIPENLESWKNSLSKTFKNIEEFKNDEKGDTSGI